MLRSIAISLAAAALAALATPAAARAPAPADPIKAAEQAWVNAMIAKDARALRRILAPDWTGQNDSGKVADRAEMIANYTSGKSVITALKLRDMKVRYSGNMAVIQGSDDETSTWNGKDSSGAYTWTDIFERRGGRWLAVASQVTQVKTAP